MGAVRGAFIPDTRRGKPAVAPDPAGHRWDRHRATGAPRAAQRRELTYLAEASSQLLLLGFLGLAVAFLGGLGCGRGPRPPPRPCGQRREKGSGSGSRRA